MRRLLLALVGVMAVSLLNGVSTGFAATPSTVFDAIGVDSPDPAQTSGRWPERLIDAGDLTGDGVRDIFGSSYLMDVAGVVNAGKVVLVSGGDRSIRYELVSPELQGDSGGNFGFYISVPGDVNGDGKDDLVVGAPYQDVYTGTGSGCGTPEPNGCNENQGKAYVYSGPTGRLLYSLNNPNPQPDEGVFATFGARIGAAGDVVNAAGQSGTDGRADIIVGSPANDVPTWCGATAPFPAGCRKNEGETFIFSGATGQLFRTLRIPEADRQEPSCTAPGNSRCGHMSVPQSPGDIDRDGVVDHFVSAYGLRRPNIVAPQFFGRIYLFSGATGAVLSRIDQPAPDNNAFWGLQDVAPNSPGDVNADGVPDLYGTGFGQDGAQGEVSAGRGWVFDGRSSVATGTGQVLYEVKDPAPAANKAYGWAESKTDYNKDGRPDLVVSNLSGSNTSFNIFDGRDGSLFKTLSLPPSLAQPNQPGNGGNALGWSSRAPGDLNKDGEPDFVASGHGTDIAGVVDAGKMFFFLSNVPRQIPPRPYPPPPYPPPPLPLFPFEGCPSSTANVILGTAGNDTRNGTPGADRIFAGAGDDVIDGLPGNDCIDLGTGADRGEGGQGDDLILGQSGGDRLSGSSGRDRLRGGAGNDQLTAGSGNDRAFGDAGNDRIVGSFGNDVLHGVRGNDNVSGGRGNDRINGGAGRDSISGGNSNDRVAGDQGADRINGNAGRDRINGNSGNDRISARDRQRDTISCGTGRDTVTADRIDRVARDCERVRRR